MVRQKVLYFEGDTAKLYVTTNGRDSRLISTDVSVQITAMGMDQYIQQCDENENSQTMRPEIKKKSKDKRGKNEKVYKDKKFHLTEN